MKIQLINHSQLLRELHNNQISAVAYPQAAKVQKQIKFADRMGINVVVIIGPSEIETGHSDDKEFGIKFSGYCS